LIDKLPVSISKSPQYIAPRDYELRLPNLAAKPGEQIHAPIAINDATGLNYGGVIIKYDASVLKAVDVAALGMLSGSYWKANTRTGEVRFAFATPTHSYHSEEGIPMEEIPPNPPLLNGSGEAPNYDSENFATKRTLCRRMAVYSGDKRRKLGACGRRINRP
jgi:hypothetical protein